VPLHGTVAAVQLRQHPFEAGESREIAEATMFLLDDILMLPLKLPVAGFNWIMKQIQTMANEELMNDQPWKERLIELQMMLEVGDLTEDEYTEQEAEVLQARRDIGARKGVTAREQ